MMGLIYGMIPSILGQDKILAILSSDLKPYSEAFQGFQSEMEVPVPSIILNSSDPPNLNNSEIIVAFGGKAISTPIPKGKKIIGCLAPGFLFDFDPNKIIVVTSPSPEVLVQRILDITPNIKRLGVLWNSEAFKDDVDEVNRIGKNYGLNIVSTRNESIEQLPSQLRSLINNIDALWIPPDPKLITAETFLALKDFSTSSKIPLYVPTSGLVEKGAFASISPSFKEIGKEVGRIIKSNDSNDWGHKKYSSEVEVTINQSVSQQLKIELSKDSINKAQKVYQ